MAKLYFKYGTMKSGKSLDLIRTHDTYVRSGRKVLVITPSTDSRFGKGKVRTRLGIEVPSKSIEVGTLATSDIIGYEEPTFYDAILVDEAQFFKEDDIRVMRDIASSYDIPVLAYGLKTDFRGKLFKGSKALLELSEDISEIKAVCEYCDSKAIMNLRLLDGKPIYDGEVVQLGDTEYVQVCYKHFKKGEK